MVRDKPQDQGFMQNEMFATHTILCGYMEVKPYFEKLEIHLMTGNGLQSQVALNLKA